MIALSIGNKSQSLLEMCICRSKLKSPIKLMKKPQEIKEHLTEL